MVEILVAVLAVLLAILGYRVWQRRRVAPEEWERRRRAHLTSWGKMGDAVLVELHENLLFYTYNVRGVEYTASQDLSKLAESEDLTNLGAMCVKYDPKNPANSIVLSEEWSGLHARK